MQGACSMYRRLLDSPAVVIGIKIPFHVLLRSLRRISCPIVSPLFRASCLSLVTPRSRASFAARGTVCIAQSGPSLHYSWFPNDSPVLSSRHSPLSRATAVAAARSWLGAAATKLRKSGRAAAAWRHGCRSSTRCTAVFTSSFRGAGQCLGA